mmetsp:Transcript_41966/g.57248  ORF Transcript_41966/g.57248 Transcript_41966/m.57248 type:complete len:192 (-) Transcript_41966:350-925(-)
MKTYQQWFWSFSTFSAYSDEYHQRYLKIFHVLQNHDWLSASLVKSSTCIYLILPLAYVPFGTRIQDLFVITLFQETGIAKFTWPNYGDFDSEGECCSKAEAADHKVRDIQKRVLASHKRCCGNDQVFLAFEFIHPKLGVDVESDGASLGNVVHDAPVQFSKSRQRRHPHPHDEVLVFDPEHGTDDLREGLV